MYRVGQGALDQKIAQVISAIAQGEHLRRVDEHLRDEMFSLRGRIAHLSHEPLGSKRLSLEGLWSLLKSKPCDTETAIHKADRVILVVALETEVKFVSARRLKVTEELRSLVGASERLTELLAEKEAWLVSADAPGKETILEIARLRGHWEALAQCLNSANQAATDAQSQILQATTYYQDAHDPRSRMRAQGSNSGSKQGQLQQASVHAGMAEFHTRSLYVELAAIEVAAQPLALELAPVLASGGKDRREHQVLTGTTLQRDSEWIFEVITAVSSLQRQSKDQVRALESKRRKELAGHP